MSDGTAPAAASPLLVPIQLEALVIEGDASRDASANGELLLAKPTGENGASLRWKAARADYRRGLRSLTDPRIDHPFQGAVPEKDGGRLGLRDSERPKRADRGVYLRWIVPDGLRKSLAENSLNFPSLPDQWLILRLARQKAAPKVAELKAWVIDGSAYPGNDTSAILPVAIPGGGDPAVLQLRAQPVGTAEPLESYKAAEHASKARTPITALGTCWTGSPTFATSLAENRNILSWHDTLSDLRDDHDRLPLLAAVSYAVVGWYFFSDEDPLAALPRVLKTTTGAPADLRTVLGHLGWDVPDDVGTVPGPCLFHGQVAHINFWNAERYRGPLLGYPQSPPAHAGLSLEQEKLTVGLGTSAQAALSALVSDRCWDDEVDPKDRPKWAVLEGRLLGAADPAALEAGERRRLDHALGFKSLDAGMLYSFVQGEDEAARSKGPTADQAKELARLNGEQSALNDELRALIARGNALRLAWLERVRALRQGGGTGKLAGLEADLEAFVKSVETARQSASGLAEEFSQLDAGLPKGWSLRADAEPRFWAAADPVVMLAGLPGASRLSLPSPLPCRKLADLVTTAPVMPQYAAFPGAALSELTGTIATRGLPHAAHLAALLGEAARLEQSVASAAFESAAAPFAGQTEWRTWKDALQSRFRSGKPGESTMLAGASGRAVPPEALVSVWGQQPWSPLYIDWRLTWHSSPNGLRDWVFQTRQAPLHYDYRQPAAVAAAGQKSKTSIKGRSLIAAMSGGFFSGALKAATDEAPLNSGDFTELTNVPLVAQDLSGLVSAVCGGTPQGLMPSPNVAMPWLTATTDGLLEVAMNALSRLAADHRIAMTTALPLRGSQQQGDAPLNAGWFRIEHLWVVDDFGQWAEPVGRPETRVQPHPRSRIRLTSQVDDTLCGPFALPPRLVDAARLDVHFVGSDSPIRGWLYVNRMDNALVLCAGDGRLLGELALVPDFRNLPAPRDKRVVWRSLAEAGQVGLASIPDPVLAHLAAWLADETKGADRLAEMMRTVEQALPTIQSLEAAPEQMLVGRPLAVTTVTARLQSFRGEPGAQPGAPLSLPLRIGNGQNRQDGLVGYAEGTGFSAFASIHAAVAPHVGFGKASEFVLVMDPFASVEFACGVLPAKSISLPSDQVRAVLARIEICLGVGPVLFQGKEPILPPPASNGGTWVLREHGGTVSPVPALSIDPRFDGSRPSAAEGRLILRRSPTNASSVLRELRQQ